MNYLAELWPATGESWARAVILTFLCGGLALANYRGVEAGACLSNVFVVAKLVPLAGLIVAGSTVLALHVQVPRSVPLPQPHLHSWLEVLLLLSVSYGGFDAAVMSLAEVRNPPRDVPFALMVGLLVVTAVYTMLQAVVVLTIGAVETGRPLVLAGRQLMGSNVAVLLSVGALLSRYGLLASQFLNVPRLMSAMGDHSDLPRLLAAIHARFRTPQVSIVMFASIVWAMSVWGTYRWAVAVGVGSRMIVYGSVCAALPVLRRKQPEEGSFHVPFGPVVSVLGVLISFALVLQIRWSESLANLVPIAVATLNWLYVLRRS